MKIFATIFAGILFTCAAKAEVVIYSQAYSETTTGLSSTTVTNFGGYVIFDNQGGFQQVDACAKTKQFQVWDYSSVFVVSLFAFDLGQQPGHLGFHGGHWCGVHQRKSGSSPHGHDDFQRA